MTQNSINHITIDFVLPKHTVGVELEGCYFVYDWSNGTYSFFQEGSDEPLKTGLEKGHHFDFNLSVHPQHEWKLHISKKSTPVMVEGKWKFKDRQKQEALSSDDWEPEQSYQATAGGSGSVEDETNAATAGA